MKQRKTIERLKKLFPTVPGLEAAILYGSFGRNEAGPNSDIDIQLLVSPEFENRVLVEKLKLELQQEVQFILEVSMRDKVVVYFNTQPKLELGVCTKLSEIDRNYIGSEITNSESTVLYERLNSPLGIREYLAELIKHSNNRKNTHSIEKQITELIGKFIYEFESCSAMQRRSDGYQFYFFYNIALQVAIQLNHLSKGQTRFNFLPKNFIANVLTSEEQKNFYELRGTLFLPEANQQKRKLLDFFYSAIERLVSSEKLQEIKQFCEWLYERDFFWNFRDISTHNPNIRSGWIFRTATLTLFQKDYRLQDLLSNKNIKTIIDLRADKEIAEIPYSAQSLENICYVKAQLDPWNQPDWFKEKHHQGTNDEIAYRFFAIACKDKIKAALEAILNEETGSVAIHCFAGKDRTGIIISLLHLLSGATNEQVALDYLASEVDVDVKRLNLILDIIAESGGIEPYLLSCGLIEMQLQEIKQKLMK
ncbi:MAG: tyrosine-protein phosphatase [Bacteroidia bacterium]|nr:tyrosine-protein phosphatase [Bacteroidia bacterium]